MKPPLVVDKSLLYDQVAWPTIAPQVAREFQAVVPSHVILEFVSKRDSLSPPPALLTRLRDALALVPDAVACPVPQAYLRKETQGESPHILDLCSGDLLMDVFLPGFDWATAITNWRGEVKEGMDLLVAMAPLVPRMLRDVGHKGAVTEAVLDALAADRVGWTQSIYTDIWRPRLGSTAPTTPGPMTAVRIGVFLLGAVMLFGRYNIPKEMPKEATLFNEAVDLDIRSLAIVGDGFGCRDVNGQKVFGWLAPGGRLVS